MNTVFDILKQKKLQCFFLFYIILLIPILTPIAQNLSIIDKFAVFLVCGLLFLAIWILSLFISSKTEKIIYSILLTISIIPGAIYLAYLLFAHVMLEQNSVTSLFETNPEESKEFVAYYLSIWVIVGVLIYTAIPIVMICMMKSFKPLSVKKNKALFITSIVIVLLVVGVNRISRSVYFVNFYKTFISYKLRTSHEIKTINERQSYDYAVQSTYHDSIPQTIVVVIGESLSRHHMSLYGYARKTNPLLEQYSDSAMFVYTDVVSPQVHTIPVMRSLLSMTEKGHSNYFIEKPSMFELFNRAGYETILISNQGFSDNYRSSFDILLSLAQKKTNLAMHKQHDDIVLPVLSEILNTKSTKNRLILIHLIGNHMAYEFRYPKEYIVFDHKKDNLVPDAPYMDVKAKKMIDKYDNSVLFNDYIINNIISILDKAKDQNTAMIYFSDHAEEMYEYREFAGHAYEKVSPTMCEVPFLAWLSSGFKKHSSGLIFQADRPYSNADFIFSISDFAGLKYDDFDASRSIFSKSFEPRERYVGDKKYTDIKKSFE